MSRSSRGRHCRLPAQRPPIPAETAPRDRSRHWGYLLSQPLYGMVSDPIPIKRKFAEIFLEGIPTTGFKKRGAGDEVQREGLLFSFCFAYWQVRM